MVLIEGKNIFICFFGLFIMYVFFFIILLKMEEFVSFRKIFKGFFFLGFNNLLLMEK